MQPRYSLTHIVRYKRSNLNLKIHCDKLNIIVPVCEDHCFPYVTTCCFDVTNPFCTKTICVSCLNEIGRTLQKYPVFKNSAHFHRTLHNLDEYIKEW